MRKSEDGKRFKTKITKQYSKFGYALVNNTSSSTRQTGYSWLNWIGFNLVIMV